MSLIGWWKLDGDASDSSGYGNNGTANGVSWVDGKIGQCGEFDGSDDNVVISHSDEIQNRNYMSVSL